MKSPAWKETLKKQDWEDFYQPGDAFGKFIDDENKRIGDILAALGLGKK